MNDVIANIGTFLLPLILSISVHEWAHAATTTALGDDTAKAQGRVTLNPFAHIDWVWTVLVPMLALQVGGLLIAAGKPVPYNPMRWRRELWGRPLNLRFGALLVAAAGPLSNLGLAALAALALKLSASLNLGGATLKIFGNFIYLNALLAVFNLIPMPPLDGSKILGYFAPEAWAQRLDRMGAMGLLILLFLLWRTPVGGYISAAVQGLNNTLIGWAI